MDDLNYSCEKKPAVTYSLRGKGWWANITIREWPRGGSIDVHSDYGDYAHMWGSIGDESLRAFLCSLDMDYFMDKTEGRRGWRIFDAERTANECRRIINEARHDGRVSESQAMQAFASVLNAERHLWDDADVFLDAISKDIHPEAFKKIFGSPVDIPCITKPSGQADGFWNMIWPCACDVWRKELNGEAD